MEPERKNRKVLILDDDPEMQIFLSTVLTTGGFTPLIAESGQEAIRIAVAESPALIILDVMMATWDEGFEVVQKIRNNPKLAATPIIMLTAVSQQMGIRYDKDKETLPVEEFIEKPVMPGTLLNIIKKYI